MTMFTFASAVLGFSSPALAQTATASLSICSVSAAEGGCANGTSSPPGFVTFDFSGFLPGDTFIGGLPATSPAQAPASGEIEFSLNWHTRTPGVDTPEQTIFFTEPNGLVADVLNYTSSVTGGAGRDFMDIVGYVLALSTPVTVADLAGEGIAPTGSVSLPTVYKFAATDLAATFQPAPIPELPTWGLMALGLAALGVAGARGAGARGTIAA
jgi:hypothetical protein